MCGGLNSTNQPLFSLSSAASLPVCTSGGLRAFHSWPFFTLTLHVCGLCFVWRVKCIYQRWSTSRESGSVLAPSTVFSSLPSEQPWEANTITILSDEEPEALGGNFTYPRSPPTGDMTLSKPHYLPEPPDSSSVKGGTGHLSQGCCEDL